MLLQGDFVVNPILGRHLYLVATDYNDSLCLRSACCYRTRQDGVLLVRVDWGILGLFVDFIGFRV